MSFNFKIIRYNLGYLLLIESIFLLFVSIYSFIARDGVFSVLMLSTILTGVCGLILKKGNKLNFGNMGKRDIYLTVFLGWIIMSIFGSLPYLFSSSIPMFADAIFETISGFTTTGATVVTNIEGLPRGILLWRSLTQWIGGMGIIVLIIAILPAFGIKGIQLFEAESPGIFADKFRPGIKKTAIAMWLVYLGLTLLEVVILYLVGMSLFDAVNHSMTTMSTGGFSTHSESIAFFPPIIQYIMILFMFIAGTNFALVYLGIYGKLSKIYKNEEWRYYLFIILVSFVVVFYYLYSRNFYGLEGSFRVGLFQVVSMITTTGYVTADLTTLAPVLTFIFFLLLFVGGMTGSTSGGVKTMRLVLLLKESLLVLRKQLHPNGSVIPLRFNKGIIKPVVAYRVMVFLVLYILILVVSTGVMLMLGVDLATSLGAVATTLGNVGPGLGVVGPVGNFSTIPQTGKWLLGILMVVGRLELFTVLVMLTPWFWRD